MRNILAVIGAAVVVFGGLGWYLEWYKLGTQAGADGYRKIEADVNVKKIVADVKKGEQKVIDILPEKKVDGQTTGFHFDPDATRIVVPPGGLPPAPTVNTRDLVNPDGTLRVVIPPPPAFTPGG